MPKFSKELDTAIKASKKAGKILMKYYKKENVKNSEKTDKSFVSEADLASEKIILDIIKKEFPNYSIQSEEEGLTEKKSEYCWHIDPLDGTHNFLHKIPMFSVSIALAKNNEFIIGVVYNPVLNELFYAEKNKGAYFNSEKIVVSKTILKNSLGILPSSYQHYGKEYFKIINSISPLCNDARMICSCAIELSYIASGRADFAIHPKTTPHDAGAGAVILREAGGKITDIKGNKFTSKSTNFIASNNVFHKELIKIMKKEGF